MEERALFDHPIAKREHFRRDVTPDRLCGLEVEHQLKCRWLLDWQIGGFGAFQYFVDHDGGRPEVLLIIRSI